MKKDDFKSQLRSEKGTEAQEELAMEKLISEVWLEIHYLDLENGQTGPKLNDIVKKIGTEYDMVDTTQLFEEMKKALDSGKYTHKLDERGCVCADYTEAELLRKKEQDKYNQIANRKLQNYVSRALKVLDRLPEIIEQEEFKGKRVEQGLLNLAIGRAIKIYQERQKEEPEEEITN